MKIQTYKNFAHKGKLKSNQLMPTLPLITGLRASNQLTN